MSEYTNFKCPMCGVEFAANHAHMCGDAVGKQIVERMREIARQEARAEMKAYAEEMRAIERTHIGDIEEVARDAALEEAAAIVSRVLGVETFAAQEIRALKSQPAAREFAGIKIVPDSAQENDTMQWKPDPTFRGVPITPHPQREEIVKPAAQASAEKPSETLRNISHAYDVIASLRKERDEARAKLAASEKALANVSLTGPDADGLMWLRIKSLTTSKEGAVSLHGHGTAADAFREWYESRLGGKEQPR